MLLQPSCNLQINTILFLSVSYTFFFSHLIALAQPSSVMLIVVMLCFIKCHDLLNLNSWWWRRVSVKGLCRYALTVVVCGGWGILAWWLERGFGSHMIWVPFIVVSCSNSGIWAIISFLTALVTSLVETQ